MGAVTHANGTDAMATSDLRMLFCMRQRADAAADKRTAVELYLFVIARQDTYPADDLKDRKDRRRS
jgi:hypothetical protein